jgi:F0F1-type ATP synthase assembly protein I
MSRNVLARASRQSVQILCWQLAWIGALALVCGVVFGLRVGASVLAGGGIGVLWTVYMAVAMFKHSLDHGARLSVLSFVGGWVIKVVLTVSLLIIAFRTKALLPPVVLGGLFWSMVAFWYSVSFRVKYADSSDGK